MKIGLSSRQRMLNAIACQISDHIPCAFMSFTALRRRVNEDFFALCKSELEFGLDSFLFIPSLSRQNRPDHPELRGLPVRPSQDVKLLEWVEQGNGQYLLHKEYHTPSGILSTCVKASDDWPHGDHIPFIDDYQVPRAIKPLVCERKDLEALRFMLTPPNEEDKQGYYKEAERARNFATENGVMLVGGWGVGMDMANWLCGMQELMALTIQDQAFVEELLDIIFDWNYQRMQTVLSAPVDLFIKRAWYEGCDFVTPRFYRNVLLPRLIKEVELVHEHGSKFGYILSSGIVPMLDMIRDSGIDVLIGVDPIQGTHTDLATIKRELGGKVCLWGGVSGAVTVELGGEADVRHAVHQAIQTLGPDGFILSPTDNITVDASLTWSNLEIFKDEWRKSWRN